MAGPGCVTSLLVIVVVVVVVWVGQTSASWGDTSHEYRECNNYCRKHNCTQPSDLARWQAAQPLPQLVLGLSCSDDCSYDCMWITTEIMFRRFSRVPQFHGRWPFVRLFGIQEPASTLFSLLNLASHLYMLVWFLRTVPPNAPMAIVWVLYAIISINAWLWSTVFHTKDTQFTEMMDYFCAFSTVLFSLLAFLLRMVVDAGGLARFLVSGSVVGFYLNHVISMATVRFDYGYNMKVNVAVGGLNCVAWIVWFFLNWNQGDHIRKGLTAVLALTLSVSLELLDFAPVLWILDSHALWHLVTAPLPLLWYQFAAGDCHHLLHTRKTEGAKKGI